MAAYLAKPVVGVPGIGLLTVNDGVPVAAFGRVDVLRGFVRFLPATEIELQSGECGCSGAGAREELARLGGAQGGERFAASDFAHALAYYRDAVSACPTNARAQLNLARTYESLGDSTQARTHYELAANSSGSDASAAQEARAALARLQPARGT